MQKRNIVLAFALLFGISFSNAQKTRSAAPPSADKIKPALDPRNLYPPADTLPPSISCIPNLTVDLQPGGSFNLWANDMLLSAIDNNTPWSQLHFGVREAGTGQGFPLDINGAPITQAQYDCVQQGVHSLEVWVMDLAGNASSCLSSVTLQDSHGYCSETPGLIHVRISTNMDCSLGDLQFKVDGVDPLGIPFHFIESGELADIQVPPGSTGTITPIKDNLPLNGVTSFDVALLINHLHGTQLLSNPYKLIAADVNKDGVINSQDSTEIRRLILGLDETFRYNTSWRFVLNNYNFPSPTNPFLEAFPESFSFTNIQEEYDVKFKGIKIGDLNFTAGCNNLKDDSGAERSIIAKDTGIADKNKPPYDPSKIYPTADSEPPMVTCLNGLSANIMPTGLIALWATDLLLDVVDNVTPFNQIKLGIRKAGTGTGFPVDNNGNPQQYILFTCEEQGDQIIELWAKDLAGNTSFCTSPLIIMDNNQVCGGSGGFLHVCAEKYCDQTPLGEAYLNVFQDSLNFVPPFWIYTMSDNSGCWNLNSIPIALPVHFTPVKDDNPLNGISSYDLKLLSDHIHGIHPFTEPWQWVAADVNNDLVVDIQDSIELRKLILGIYQELPNNTSWRFVRSDYVFPSPNPLAQPYPESFSMAEWISNPNLKFLGIKIGNLSCLEPRPVPERSESGLSEGQILVSPNPTNVAATLAFQLWTDQTIRLQVRDITGKLTADQVLNLSAGQQSVTIPEMALPTSGVFFWSLQIGKRVESGKLVRL